MKKFRCEGLQCIGFWLLLATFILWLIIFLNQLNYENLRSILESSLLSAITGGIIAGLITTWAVHSVDKQAEKRWLKENQTKKAMAFMLEFEEKFRSCKLEFVFFEKILFRAEDPNNIILKIQNFENRLSEAKTSLQAMVDFQNTNGLAFKEVVDNVNCNKNIVLFFSELINNLISYKAFIKCGGFDTPVYYLFDGLNYKNIIICNMCNYYKCIDGKERLQSIFADKIPEDITEQTTFFNEFFESTERYKYFDLIKEDIDNLHEKVENSQLLSYYKDAIN